MYVGYNPPNKLRGFEARLDDLQPTYNVPTTHLHTLKSSYNFITFNRFQSGPHMVGPHGPIWPHMAPYGPNMGHIDPNGTKFAESTVNAI